MTNKDHMDISSALADVREAYRFIWAYQNRCLDTAMLLGEQFSGMAFYQWSNIMCDQPPKRGTRPFGRWGWDFLPLYACSFLFTTEGSSDNTPRKGDWMLEVKLTTDTACEEFMGGSTEPDPLRFGPARRSQSLISLIVWKCQQDFAKNENWLHHAWDVYDWPENSDGTAVESADGRIVSCQVSRPLEELSNRDSVIAFAERGRDAFERQLKLKLT